jgi:hypothetical protein
MTIDQAARRSIFAALPLMAIFAASQGCGGAGEPNGSEGVTQIRQAESTDPVPCAAWADTVVGNTGSISIGASTLIDSYQSSLGAYGGTNVGSAAVVQAGTTISNNGGVVHGTQKQHAPAGFAVVPVPQGAKNLPLGSRTPGTLSIGTAAQSITLAPGNYVAANINVSSPGAINVSPPGEVRIWVTGSLNLGGNLNLNGIPKNLAFLVTSSGFVNINNGALYGLVYAPTSVVFVSGKVFGTVIGSSTTLNSGGAVHFDQSSECASNQAKLDQSFITGNDLSDGLYGHPVLMGQSYTAGITGTLQGVSIDVSPALDPTLVARIQIEAIVGGVPSNVVLGSTRAPAPGDISINTVIPFSTGIPQVAGQEYVILVDYPEAPPFFNGIENTASWNGSDGNLYPRGTEFSTFDNGATWTSGESQGFDLHFQTFVIPQ